MLFSNVNDLVACGTGLFLAVVFVQSGLDKIFDYKGNRAWLDGHFSKTFLKNTVGLLLPVLTLMETAGGFLCGIGAALALCGVTTGWLVLLTGHLVVAAALLALMFGQRVAKDYAGAASLTGYILLALLGWLALTS